MLLNYAQQLKPRDRRATFAPAFSLLLHGIILAFLILWMPHTGPVTPPKPISVELVEPTLQADEIQQNSSPQAPVSEILPRLIPAPPVAAHLQPLPLPAQPASVTERTEKAQAASANAEMPVNIETGASPQSAPARSEGVFDPGRPLSRQEPVYPDQAARRGLEGTVELRFTILADGRTDDLRVVSSDPPGMFDEAAIRSQRTARYTPANRDGVPVAQPDCRVVFHFKRPL